MPWFTSFLYSQLLVSLAVPTTDLTGQTIIVTGANTGLGLEAARHFSRLNASHLIIAVRNLPKGEAAKSNILASTKRSADSIEVWELDLQSFESVKAFAARASKLERIDGLLENAGIVTKHFTLVQGFESVITTNVISTFLLALLMLPKLRETAARFKTRPRLSIVASDLHFIASFAQKNRDNVFDALNDEAQATMGMERYATSKLLEVLIVRELAARMTAKDGKLAPIVNCMTPGACKSDFNRESQGVSKALITVAQNVIARTTEAGSRTLVAGIVAGEESHGAYMADCHVAE
ncbi:MAG: hypothetical protein LQ340_007792 [Diploschistes diacapsis]|nr:MAG: hypothetical protein LQ340_007792 [Diploschistes diacapsis]